MSMSAAPTLQQLLPWKARFMPWQGGRVHYLDEGPRDAPVLLCLHGFPTWSLLFRQPLAALAISEQSTLLVYGGLDRTLEIEAATRELGAAFPQHRSVHLPVVGHFVPEEAGDLLSSLLASFLREGDAD